MKIGIFSDIHLHKHKAFSGADGNRRLMDGLIVLEHCFRLFIKHKCDHIVFCGDFFHNRRHVDWYTFNHTRVYIRRILEKLPENVLVHFLVGNHDWYDAQCNMHSLDFLKDYKPFMTQPKAKLQLLKPVLWKREQRVEAHMVPWLPRDQQEEYLQSVKRSSNSLSLLFIHTQPAGAVTPAGFRFSDGINFDKYRKKFDFIFCGDIHKHQMLKKKVAIIGSPMHHTFADRDEDRGIIIFDTVSKERKFIKMNKWFPQFRIVEDIQETNTYDYFRLVTSETAPELTDNIEFVHGIVQEGDAYAPLDFGMSAEEAVAEYVKTHSGDLDADMLFEMGMEYI